MPTTKKQKKTSGGHNYLAPGMSKVNGVPYFKVPAAMITMPKDNTWYVARKQLNYTDKSGRNQVATYVMGFHKSSTTNKQGKQNKIWFVARLQYLGGKPGIASYYYRDYSRRGADNYFKRLPSTNSYYRVFDEKGNMTDEWKTYAGHTRQELNKMRSDYRKKRKEYYAKREELGTAAQRKAYVAAHPEKYPQRSTKR